MKFHGLRWRPVWVADLCEVEAKSLEEATTAITAFQKVSVLKKRYKIANDVDGVKPVVSGVGRFLTKSSKDIILGLLMKHSALTENEAGQVVQEILDESLTTRFNLPEILDSCDIQNDTVLDVISTLLETS